VFWSRVHITSRMTLENTGRNNERGITMPDEKKSEQQILKERALEKACEVISIALEKSWDQVWTSKNRIIKGGSDGMTIGVSLKLEKITDSQLHITCGPAWQESHKGHKAGADVTTQDDMFSPVQEEEDVKEEKPEEVDLD